VRVKITTLAENSATIQGTLAEHGLSMLLQLDDLWVLLDTGFSDTAVHNAHALKIDLSRVSHIVMSHGHRDHSGGLLSVLAETGEVTVHGHVGIWKPRYGVPQNQKPKYAGLPYVREMLESLGATFDLSDGPVQLSPQVMTTGPVPRNTPFETLDARLKVRVGQGWVQDQIEDDQSLLVKTPRGLVVMLGCAHSGIVNTLYRAQEVSGEKRIYAVLGGTHLKSASREQLEKTVDVLKQLDIQKIGVSHCTGMVASAVLAQEFGDRFFFNNVGTVTDWEF